PNGIVPPGSVTAVSTKPNDRKHLWRELSVSRFGFPGNWGEQGADAGLYHNSDIWGIRILILEPVSEVISRQRRHFALGSDSEDRIRIPGDSPGRPSGGRPSAIGFRPSAIGDRPEPPAEGRKPTADQPLDPDGNPDTSFLAKIPADVAFTFQTIDNKG